MSISVLGVLGAIAIAWSIYLRKKTTTQEDSVKRRGVVAWSYQRFYMDEFCDFLVQRPLNALAVFFYRVMDGRVIDGFVNGIGKTVMAFSTTLRLVQTGRIGSYLFLLVAGIILIFLFNYWIFSQRLMFTVILYRKSVLYVMSVSLLFDLVFLLFIITLIFFLFFLFFLFFFFFFF